MARKGGGRSTQAMRLQEQAEKKEKKFDWFGASREANMEAAAELYVKAAAQWKISKEFGNAGECYKKAAECNMAAENAIEANSNWREAGKAYRHVDAQLAINAYKNAIEHYLANDRFNQAARLTEEIAEMLAEDESFEKAIEQYEECADLYETDGDATSANKRLLKVAHMSAKIHKWKRAIELFEKVAIHNVDSNLLRWNVKTLLFKAFICVMNDACEQDDQKWWANIQENKLEKYKGISDLFASSRECKLCEKLYETVPKHDVDGFQGAVSKYDAICKLDAWMTDQILFQRRYMEGKMHAAPSLDGAMDEDDDDGGGAYLGGGASAAAAGASSGQPSGQGANPFDDGPKDLGDAPDLL